jgi:hypothetical protein
MPLDLFSPKSTLKKDDEDQKDDDAFIVDVDEASATPPKLATPEIVNGQPSMTDQFREGVRLFADETKGKSEIGLSIAASIVGSTLGAINATAGTIKNLADYVVSGGNLLLAKALSEPGTPDKPTYYDGAEQLFFHDVDAVWQDMQDDYNVVAGAIQYEPESEYGHRFVVNMNDKMQGARQWIGDRAAGIPTVDVDGEDFEVDSLAEIDALRSLDNSPTGEIRKVMGAAGQSLIDVGLMVVGGLVAKGGARPSPGIKPTAAASATNALGLKGGQMTTQALDALENSKPRFNSIEQATNRIEELASGKARQQITVETVEGLPTKVLGGQDAILALKELQKRGANIKEVKVNFVERDVIKGGAPNASGVAKANQAFKVDLDAEARLAEASKKSIKNNLVKTVVDASGNVKRAILKSSGDLGVKAVRDLELAAGATPRAIAATNDAWHRIFKNLSNKEGSGIEVGGVKIPTERQLFDQFVRANRILAISKTKTGVNVPKFEGNATAVDMANWLQAAKQQLGPQRYAELSIRADELFKVARTQLDKLHSEGLITLAEFNKMKDINYLRTEFIDQLDPITNQKIGGNVIQVGESGIQPIGKGSTKGAFLDAEALMNETVIRTENRIARNRANKRLWDIAQADPKNNVIKQVKIGKDGNPTNQIPGWEVIRARVGGKTVAVQMPEWLAQEWKMGDPAISATAANIMRIVSGSAMVRPLATGYNPAFVVTNLPRDIVHAWLSTNRMYSAVLPKYLLQVGRDMMTVAKDSLTKSGRYDDYINEGGGMSFLTHQGRDVVARSSGDLAIRHRPKLALLRDTLSYLNEQSEIMLRLAIRERVLRNQREAGLPLDSVEATWQARRYLDFSQGGNITKVFDNAVPYLNATTQAYRTVARSAKERPAEFAAKALQLGGLYAGWEAYNMLFNADAHQQIPEKVRRKNFIIHTGDFIIDEEGNKRYEYYTVAKDPSTLGPTVWLEQLMDFYVTGQPPTDSTFQYITESLPGFSASIPVLSAAHTYLSDYNFWYGKDIFGRDLNIEDYAKFKGLPGEPTDQVFKDFGEIFNLKPEALQQASAQLVPSNTYLQLAGKAYEVMLADADPRERGRTTEERMARMPLVNRIYKLTHPASVALDNMDRIAKPVNTEEFLRTQKLKEILFEASRSRDYNAARQYAQGFANDDPFVYKDMMNRIVATQRLDTIFEKRKAKFEDLPKTWWMGMLGLPSKARAEVYFEEWTGESSERKRFMDSTAASLSSGELNFMDTEFLYHLTKLKNERNSESLHDVNPDGKE